MEISVELDADVLQVSPLHGNICWNMMSMSLRYPRYLVISVELDADVPEEVVYALLVAVLGGNQSRPQLSSSLPNKITIKEYS